jgi:dolichyl-diphosphooligosaccharide--protein glycosyltransferase
MVSIEIKYPTQVDFMISLDLKNRRTYLIMGLVAFFTLFALWLRLLPMLTMGNTDPLSMVASDDPVYNLRQVELLVTNHLNYPWFDPMTLYPTGSNIYWGPLFPTIIAICCLITGATTRPEIISIGLLIPPLMAAAVTVIMYFVGKACGDWKTGILASGFAAIVTGQYFYRSLYGYMDHHIAEVLFSTIFCLFYLYAVLSAKDVNIDLKNIHSYKSTILFSVLAGIAYLLGFFVMPTMILFAFIVGIFTLIQFVIDTHRNRTSEYLLIINTIIFLIAIIGTLAFGFKSVAPELSTYSIAHIYADLGMIGGTIFLFILQVYQKGKERYYYPAFIGGSLLLFLLALYIISPNLFTLLIADSFAFFGQAPVTNTVQEARGWSLELAWITFNYGLLLMIGGILVMIYQNVRKERPEQVFIIVWSVIILFSTWQHVRYEYYLAINVVLLSAVCVSFTLDRTWPAIRSLIHNTPLSAEPGANSQDMTESPGKKKQKKIQKGSTHETDRIIIPVAVTIIVLGLGIMFAYTSVSYSYPNALANPTLMNPDWKESVEWMSTNTPDPGVNYYTIYPKDTFTYPNGSYGVMSWWDYGHLITTIGKRIPNANPFQQGVSGDTGAAAYFMTTSEDAANNILNIDGTRYVITDIEMDSGKFWAMSTWFNASVATGPYQENMFYQTGNTAQNYQLASLNKQPYYMTMISRLHNFDGSMTQSTGVYYIEYVDPSVAQVSLPVIITAQPMNISAATQAVEQYNLKAKEGYHAEVFSLSLISPVDTVPALQHYRLVHESQRNVLDPASGDLKYVKIFEYVKGAHIKGDGIIEVPVVTNTGRNFTYRQASVNGEFIVPYSTTGNTYDVKTTGKYTIEGTNLQYDVPESAVMQGLTIG